jgi:hypothetical protein
MRARSWLFGGRGVQCAGTRLRPGRGRCERSFCALASGSRVGPAGVVAAGSVLALRRRQVQAGRTAADDPALVHREPLGVEQRRKAAREATSGARDSGALASGLCQ